jgi:hypothetical protein
MKITFHTMIVCLLSFFISCSNTRRSDYIVKIDYLNQDSRIEKDLRNGVVALDFKDYFSNDSLKIQVDNRNFLNTIISTDDVSGGALLIEVDSLKKLNKISIQLNSGTVANLKLDKDNQLFVVRYHDDVLNIKSVTFFVANR